MKKYFLSMLSILMVTMLSVSFLSCGDDNNEEIAAPSNLENILKQHGWRSDQYYDFMEWGENNASLTNEYVTLFFLGNGSGIMKCYSHEIDSHFGSSTSKRAVAFTYQINGSTVTMSWYDGTSGRRTCTYQNETLISSDYAWKYEKVALTQEDKTWIETAKYEVMPDDERCDIVFEHSWRYLYSAEGYVNIEVTLSLPASEKAYSRKLQELRATYTGPGIKKSAYGQSYMDYQEQKNTIIILSDKEYKVSKILSFKGDLPLKCNVVFSVWDGKNQEEVDLGNESFVVTGDDNSLEDNQGNDDNGENGETEEEPNKVYVETYTGILNGYKFIDLGLSVKWAIHNVGGEKPEDFGGYYAWGETETKDYYSFQNYQYGNKLGNQELWEWYDIGKDIKGTDYDVAHVKWQGKWRMPTGEEALELKNKCKITRTSYQNVNGVLITGPNGNSIFLPAADSKSHLHTYNPGKNIGCYRTSTLTKFPSIAQTIGWGGINMYLRYDGIPVRPVCE